MPEQIEVPGQGLVEFPDGMSDDDIVAAIKRNTPQSLFNAAPSFSDRALEAEREAQGGIIKSPEDVKTIGTAYGELAKGVPVAGAFVPQTEGMTKFEQESPAAAKVTQGLGGVLATAPLTAAAPWAFGLRAGGSLLPNMATGATSGGGIAAADAYARGEPITLPTIVGAGTGAAAPAIGAGVSAGLNWLKGDVPAAVQGALAGYDPLAVKWAASAAKRDGLTDQQITDMVGKIGPEGFLAQYGPAMLGRAKGVYTNTGAGQGVIRNAVEDRATGARQRIEDAITQVAGPRVNIDALTRQGQQAQAASKPLWDAFKSTKVFPTEDVKSLVSGFGEGADRVPGLEEMGLLGEAQHMAQLEALATGQPTPPMQNFFTGGERKDWPTTQSWQYVKQAIDSRIQGSLGPLGQPTQQTRLYTMLKKRLDDVIEGANPDASAVWKQARQTWAEPIALSNARKVGQGLFDRDMRRDELGSLLQQYDPPEQQALKEGVRDALAEKMDNSLFGDTQTRNMLLAPANKDKIRQVFGNQVDPEPTLKRMEFERGYRGFENEAIRNSETQIRKEAADELKPDPSQTWLSRQLKRFEYLPGVSMTPYIPLRGAAEKYAAESQAASMERARDSLGNMLMLQGPQAQQVARALLNVPTTQPLAPDQIGLVARSLLAPAPGVVEKRQQ